MRNTFLSVAILSLTLLNTGCGKTNATDSTAPEDSSTSGSVASAVGGAYNGSSSNGTVATNDNKMKMDRIETLLASLNPISSAQASTACATFNTTSLAACILNGSTSVTYSACSFGSSAATWTGGATITCPNVNTITRTETNGTTRTNAFGSVLTINTTGLSTYTGSGASVSGGGTTITKSGSSASFSIGGVQLIGTRSGTTLFNHTITTGASPLTLNTTTNELTGTVTTYHNLVHVTASSTLDVFFTAGCCTPTSGTITTTFTTSSILGTKFNGATETLTFSGCGQATYAGPDGTAGTVSLSNCI